MGGLCGLRPPEPPDPQGLAHAARVIEDAAGAAASGHCAGCSRHLRASSGRLLEGRSRRSGQTLGGLGVEGLRSGLCTWPRMRPWRLRCLRTAHSWQDGGALTPLGQFPTRKVGVSTTDALASRGPRIPPGRSLAEGKRPVPAAPAVATLPGRAGTPQWPLGGSNALPSELRPDSPREHPVPDGRLRQTRCKRTEPVPCAALSAGSRLTEAGGDRRASPPPPRSHARRAGAELRGLSAVARARAPPWGPVAREPRGRGRLSGSEGRGGLLGNVGWGRLPGNEGAGPVARERGRGRMPGHAGAGPVAREAGAGRVARERAGARPVPPSGLQSCARPRGGSRGRAAVGPPTTWRPPGRCGRPASRPRARLHGNPGPIARPQPPPLPPPRPPCVLRAERDAAFQVGGGRAVTGWVGATAGGASGSHRRPRGPSPPDSRRVAGL